jgi:hypothetical protein
MEVSMSRTGKTWLAWIVGIAVVACTDPTNPLQTPTAVQLAFAVQPHNATAGVLINPRVAVAIHDASGNLVTNATNVVTVTIASTAGAVSVADTVSTMAANGIATFTNLRIMTAGTGYTLNAASTGLIGARSTEFAITAAPASRLAFITQPSQAIEGAIITPPVQVAAQDSFGNLATEFRDSVTVALLGNPPIASLSGTTAVRAVNGVAAFNDLSITQTTAEYTLIATAGALASSVSTPFRIAKPPVPLHITTTTNGVSLDPDGYSVCVDPVPDDCMLYTAIGVNSDVTMLVAPGAHAFELEGAAANCTVGEATTVDAGDSIHVSFAITCFAAGAVRVTAATTGTDFAVTGYGFGVDGGSPGAHYSWVPLNAVVTLTAVSAGPHIVTIMTGVPENCTVSGGRSHALNVPQDGIVDVAFDVRCVLAERIAFSYYGATVVSRVDASDRQTIVSGLAPAWSPNGTRLAYECGQDICVINADRTGFARLTADGAGNRHPTWSPDGSKIAFAATHAGETSLYVRASNGSGGAQRLTQSVGFLGRNPAWSPDGTRIAFDCSVDAGNDDICWINADGTGFARLTNDPARDYGAAWKPDGSTLAFATTRYGSDEIALLSATSGSVTRIGTGLPGFTPSWSPDGTHLAFVQLVQRDYDGDWYTTAVISTANADGSGVRTVADGDQPAWKPHP